MVAALSLAECVLGGQSACVAAVIPAVDVVSFSPVEVHGEDGAGGGP